MYYSTEWFLVRFGLVMYGTHDVSGRAVRKECLDAGIVVSTSLYKGHGLKVVVVCRLPARLST